MTPTPELEKLLYQLSECCTLGEEWTDGICLPCAKFDRAAAAKVLEPLVEDRNKYRLIVQICAAVWRLNQPVWEDATVAQRAVALVADDVARRTQQSTKETE